LLHHIKFAVLIDEIFACLWSFATFCPMFRGAALHRCLLSWSPLRSALHNATGSTCEFLGVVTLCLAKLCPTGAGICYKRCIFLARTRTHSTPHELSPSFPLIVNYNEQHGRHRPSLVSLILPWYFQAVAISLGSAMLAFMPTPFAASYYLKHNFGFVANQSSISLGTTSSYIFSFCNRKFYLQQIHAV
jgi:hypothetical protein